MSFRARSMSNGRSGKLRRRAGGLDAPNLSRSPVRPASTAGDATQSIGAALASWKPGDAVDDSDGDLAGAVADCEVVSREGRQVQVRVAGDGFGDDELSGVVLGGLLEAGGDVGRVPDSGEIEGLAPAHSADDRGAGV